MSVSISTPSGRTMASAATVAPSATASQKSSANANPTALDRASARYRAAQSRYRQAKAALKAIKRQIVPVDAFGNRKPRLRGWLPPSCCAASIIRTSSSSSPARYALRCSSRTPSPAGFEFHRFIRARSSSPACLPVRRGDLSDCLRAVGSLAQHRGGPSPRYEIGP